MTDELDQTAIGEPEVGEVAGDVESAFDSVDGSMSASIPRISDIDLDDVEDAAKWAWKHTFGHRDKAPEPGGISIDIPTEEETTMRSSSVAHEDPPPPPREPEHEPEHESHDPHQAEGGR